MTAEKLYPKSADTYDSDYITVSDGAYVELKATPLWNLTGLILRWNVSPYLDSGAIGLATTANTGTVTMTTDGTYGTVANFDGSSCLTAPSATLMFGTTPETIVEHLSFNQDATVTTDNCLSYITGEGFKYRFLLSGGYCYCQNFYNDGSNNYIRQSYTKGVWNNVTFRITNSAPNVTITMWFNGTLVSSITAAKTPFASSATNIIGAENTLANKFKGQMRNLAFYIGDITDDECLAINVDGPTKYSMSSDLVLSDNITDAQMTSLSSFSHSTGGEGTVSYLVTADGGSSFLRWDGLEWTSSGTGYNSSTTLDDYLDQLDVSSQEVSLKVNLGGDGWQNVIYYYGQITYNVNTIPNIDPNGSSLVIKGNVVTPFANLTATDGEDNITEYWYKINDGTKTQVVIGSFSTLLEAFQAIQFDTTSWDAGEHIITVYAVDAFGLEGTSTLQVFVIEETVIDLSPVTDVLERMEFKINSIMTNTRRR